MNDSNVTLKEATIYMTSFKNADLTRADFSLTDLSTCNLDGAIFSKTKFYKTKINIKYKEKIALTDAKLFSTIEWID